MDSIGGINSSDPQLYGLLQGTGQTQAASGSQSSGATDGTSSSDLRQKVAGLQDQIDTAVNSALQNLDKSTDAKGVFQAVKTAIDGVLKDNGVDPSQVKPHHHHHHHGQGGSGSGASGTQQAGGFRGHIDDLLKQNGFDPDQLRQQLVSSLGSAGSASDPTAEVSGLAPGSTVDVAA
jgi:hypothetical protein